MADSRSGYFPGNAIRRALLVRALPCIAELSPCDLDDALKRARDCDFETIERIGLLACVALTAYLLRFDAEQFAALSLVARYCIQFIAAVPLLILFAGPFYLRRTRRGLEREIERRRDAISSGSQR